MKSSTYCRVLGIVRIQLRNEAFHLTLQERLKVLRAISHEIYITATELNEISTDAALDGIDSASNTFQHLAITDDTRENQVNRGGKAHMAHTSQILDVDWLLSNTRVP